VVFLNFITTTIGDPLYILPITQRLKRHAPWVRLSVTGSRTTNALIGNDSSIDEFIELSELNTLGGKAASFSKSVSMIRLFLRVVREVRARKSQLALVYIPNFSPYQLIPFLAGVPLSAGFSYPGSVFERFLSVTIPFRNHETTGEANVHLSDAGIDILRVLRIPISQDDLLLRRSVTIDEKHSANDVLCMSKIKRPFICMQVGARYKNRQWPPERFAEVANALRKSHGVGTLLVGSAAEKTIGDEIKRLAPHCVNICGGPSLGTIAALFKSSKLVIGSDSGLMHLAASVGSQTVSLFGRPNPEGTRPMGVKQSIIVRPPSWNERAIFESELIDVYSPYMLDISSKMVIEAAKKAL
jgi:ADP-heptose:LPS heptosyltransferase